MSTYKTKDGSQSGFVPGIGPVVNGYLYNAPDDLENYNFIKVADPAPAVPTDPQTPSAQPQETPAAVLQPLSAPVEQVNTQSEGISG